MNTQLRYERETQSYHVYTSEPDKENEVHVIYLPKAVFENCPPDTLDIIISKRKVHNCNCEYCVRRKR